MAKLGLLADRVVDRLVPQVTAAAMPQGNHVYRICSSMPCMVFWRQEVTVECNFNGGNCQIIEYHGCGC